MSNENTGDVKDMTESPESLGGHAKEVYDKSMELAVHISESLDKIGAGYFLVVVKDSPSGNGDYALSCAGNLKMESSIRLLEEAKNRMILQSMDAVPDSKH
jgi:hypothetical protein